MLDHFTHPLKFPSYKSVKRFEGLGNWAVKKYYQWPYRYFYRHKVRMIERMLRDKHYDSMIDFGAGPGVLTEQWYRFSTKVLPLDMINPMPEEKVDLIICSSVMEFTDLDETFKALSGCLKKNGDIVVASPMKTDISDVYFGFINDRNARNSHDEIIKSMSKHFRVRKIKTWWGLYFCALGKKA